MIAGADVVARVDGREFGLIATDSAGHFTARTWRASTVALRVARAGYLPADVAITVGLGERVATTVFLSRTMEVLEPLVVEGRSTPRLAEYGLSGFSERRRWGTLLGIGAYLGPDELKWPGRIEIRGEHGNGARTNPRDPTRRSSIVSRYQNAGGRSYYAEHPQYGQVPQRPV